jgi:hypothetical protein
MRLMTILKSFIYLKMVGKGDQREAIHLKSKKKGGLLTAFFWKLVLF